MRPDQGHPLDLNNLPEDNNYTRPDANKLTSDDTSSSAAGGYIRKKKSGGKDEAAGKVYECRFCSLKFCKSQALGGHMNRHRQERETETLNKARQLVFSNDLAPTPLGFVSSNGQSQIPHGGFHQSSNNMGSTDPSLPFMRTAPLMYPTSTRLFSNFNIPPPPPQTTSSNSPYMYTSQYPINDYLMGHVLSPTDQGTNNYTCIGAPIRGTDLSSLHNQEEGVNWGRR